MNNLQAQVKKFNHGIFGELEILIKDGKEHFPATDSARVLGYSDPHKAIKQHTKESGWVFYPVIDLLGRKQEKKFISEGNLYRLITRSKLPQAEQFEKWVFEEVLPTIRKHGAYMTPETIEQTLNDPDFIIGLASRLKEEQQARKQAEKTIEEQKPKVLFADSVSASRTSILVGELAKLLKQNGVDVGQRRLFAWLRDNGYLIKRRGSDYNMPTQKSMERKLFEIKESAITHADGHTTINKTPKVTGKGQLYFVDKFLGKGA
ncbi:phage antirepressor Ant [Bacillus wiedmannii]|uniref:phage antirepressor n=1 Tax=Bacillus wiedmannii TaxID=1890302 RepID=UPI000D086F62|nr:phage antirepressor KilAC domain-containing protein [Bacillus wiedmannii]PRT06962.1 phage antirepressor Ant [Bacillus wiedmannii]